MKVLLPHAVLILTNGKYIHVYQPSWAKSYGIDFRFNTLLSGAKNPTAFG